MAETFYMVFVYGTLKKGQPNEYFMNLLPSVKYLGLAETIKKYPLIINRDQWNLPMLLFKEEEGKTVRGEVYQVDYKSLKQLDDFEGHPEFYERTEIEVKFIEDSKELRCWTYFIKDHVEDVQQEYISHYDSAGDHGLEYDPRENDEHPSQT